MKSAAKILLIFVVLAVVALSFAALVLPRFLSTSPRAILARPRVNMTFSRAAAVQTRVTPVLHRLPALVRSNWAQGPDGDKLVLGGTYTLDEDETLDGSLVVMGGIATMETGSRVEGDAVVMGGTLRVDGTIEGDVVVLGGLVELGEDALVEGDVNTIGGHLERHEGARIEGDINSDVVGQFPFIFPVIPDIPGVPVIPDIPGVPGEVRIPSVNVGMNPVWKVLGGMIWALLRSFMWAIVAVLVVLFLPDQTERAAQTAVGQTLISGGLGLMTAVVAPLLLVVVAITIIGIPISLLGLFLLVVAWAFGFIAVGMEVGKRLAHMLKQEWALAVSAGIGTFALSLVANGVSELVACIGWLVPALIGMIGLGAVMLTRFGTQFYPPERPSPPAPVAPEEVPALAPETSPAAEDENGPSESD